VQRARAALSGRILEEGTRERSRIALQIHDDVLPYLAGAEIQADNVRSALQTGNTAQADALARATHDAVHGGIGRLREVLDALTGQIVVPGGLRRALVSALDDLRLKAGVEGVLEAPDPMPELPLAVEILVVETARGCLTNVARHAHASTVRVTLTVEEVALRLEIADDGRGFVPDAPRQGHHGLALMRQRVELARGRFAVHSQRGVGTTIQVEVPL
jgi:signal transduction histidine kinase